MSDVSSPLWKLLWLFILTVPSSLTDHPLYLILLTPHNHRVTDFPTFVFPTKMESPPMGPCFLHLSLQLHIWMDFEKRAWILKCKGGEKKFKVQIKRKFATCSSQWLDYLIFDLRNHILIKGIHTMCKSDSNCNRLWKHASRKEWLTSGVESCGKINLKGRLPIKIELCLGSAKRQKNMRN